MFLLFCLVVFPGSVLVLGRCKCRKSTPKTKNGPWALSKRRGFLQSRVAGEFGWQETGRVFFGPDWCLELVILENWHFPTAGRKGQWVSQLPRKKNMFFGSFNLHKSSKIIIPWDSLIRLSDQNFRPTFILWFQGLSLSLHDAQLISNDRRLTTSIPRFAPNVGNIYLGWAQHHGKCRKKYSLWLEHMGNRILPH